MCSSDLSEMYQLNEALLQKILSLTNKVDLTVNDNPTAQDRKSVV